MSKPMDDKVLRALGFRQGPPSPAEMVASLLRSRGGVVVDPQRLEDRAAAVRSRAKVDGAETIRHAENLALCVKRARRECELAEMDFRRTSTPRDLEAARAAQRARGEAEQALREACDFDEALFADIMWRYRR